MAACTVVPLRLERMSSLPPSCCILALIPGMPTPRRSGPPRWPPFALSIPVSRPLVADEQMRLLADASQIDRDVRCRCVAMHIGERLLHDAQERALQRQGQGIRAEADAQARL
jgi:hypothetical protein